MSFLQLFPPPVRPVESEGLYLREQFPSLDQAEQPFVYANFLSSLDGRIAIDSASGSTVPSDLTSDADFLLFQELQAHADCLITHGGYLRALEAGQLGNILQVDPCRFGAWRAQQGLKPQPDLVVASTSLKFNLPESLAAHQQRVFIATGEETSDQLTRDFADRGYEILRTGEHRAVDGRPLVEALAARGYRRIYLIAGPRMLETMVQDRQLDRLYLTSSHQLLGSPGFHTLIPGLKLKNPAKFKLRSLYYASGTDPGETYAMYEPEQ